MRHREIERERERYSVSERFLSVFEVSWTWFSLPQLGFRCYRPWKFHPEIFNNCGFSTSNEPLNSDLVAQSTSIQLASPAEPNTRVLTVTAARACNLIFGVRASVVIRIANHAVATCQTIMCRRFPRSTANSFFPIS